MSTPLKINCEIPGPADERERQSLSDTSKTTIKVLGEAWPAIRELEAGETPQETTIKLTIKLHADGGHANSKITSFARKFKGRTISIKPEAK